MRSGTPGDWTIHRRCLPYWWSFQQLETGWPRETPLPNEPSGHTPIGPGAEFDLVRRMEARWGVRAHGIGDDAAAFQVPEGHQLVVTTDASVDRVHFRRDWLSAEEIGYRA